MRPKKERVTRLDYCQYLLASQINYTLTSFAEHAEKFSHGAANRYLAGDEIRPRLVWENVKAQVVQTSYGFLVFDDTVIDKNFSKNIELVRSQNSGNAHKVTKGIELWAHPAGLFCTGTPIFPLLQSLLCLPLLGAWFGMACATFWIPDSQ